MGSLLFPFVILILHEIIISQGTVSQHDTANSTQIVFSTEKTKIYYSSPVFSNISDSEAAASSIRIRREPPNLTIIKHRIRVPKRRVKQRRRIKLPKPVYGPPNYHYGEPLNFYKPKIVYETSTPIKSSYNFAEPKPSYNYNSFDFGSDLNIQSIPGTAYGASNGNEYEGDSYDTHSVSFDSSNFDPPNFEYNKQEYDVTTPPTYYEPPAPSSPPLYKEPPKDYGPPQPIYNNPTPIAETYYVDTTPPSTDAIKPHVVYGVPPSESTSVYLPSKDSYEIPATTNTNTYDFTSGSNYESHQFSVESNLKNKYAPPTHGPVEKQPQAFPENFNERPYFKKHKPSQKRQPHTIDFPLEQKYPETTAYSSSKSSYEVPIYDPVPFRTAPPLEEIYPPIQPESYSHQHFQSIAKSSNKIEIKVAKNPSKANNLKDEEIKKDFVTATPIVSTTQKLNTQFESLIEPSSTTSSRSKRYKKRLRSTVPTIHTLDTDELKSAFNNTKREERSSHLKNTTAILPTKAPKRVNFVLRSSINDISTISPTWESTKIGSIRGKFKKDTTDEVSKAQIDIRDIADRTPAESQRVAVSIQKSRSHSFYAGTFRPDVVKGSNSNPVRKRS